MIIDVVAPGYGGKPEDIAKVAAYLRGLGFTPRIPDTIFAGDLLHSADEETRFAQLWAALNAPEPSAIWCFKGGYGTAKLLARLREMPKPALAKTIIGFSDITALHLFVQQQWGWQSLHAPVLWQLIHDKVDATCGEAVRDYLLAPKPQSFTLTPMNTAAAHYSAEALLTGGNLALLQTSLGTFWQVESRQRFLLIEEIDEAAYRVDRMLHHLAQADILQQAEAILLGDFMDHAGPEQQAKITRVLEAFAAPCPRPVFAIKDIGHGTQNLPIPLGGRAVLQNNLLTVR